MQLEFYKYQGTGNDFVLVDNRQGLLHLTTQQIKTICDRRFGIGADGFIFLNSHRDHDFEMDYYNADGRESSMCGNGGRCTVKFAYDLGIQKSTCRFMAADGLHQATMDDNSWINLKMNDVFKVDETFGDYVLDTGSPHYVKQVSNVLGIDVFKEGRLIRNSKQYASQGINVNFVELQNDKIFVRTYERGVEDETYSCGTGVTASALVFASNDGFNRVEVETPGGHLAVTFEKQNRDVFKNIWLCGPAVFVFKGLIEA